MYCKKVHDLPFSKEYDILIIGDSFCKTKFQDYLSASIQKRIITMYHTSNTESCDIFYTLLLKREKLVSKVVIIGICFWAILCGSLAIR